MSLHRTDTASVSSPLQSRVVGVGACGVSRDPQVQLVTYALGSCIAITLHDPASRTGGMLHFMLPEAAVDPERVSANPYLAADTGFPLLLQAVCSMGVVKNRLHACLAGGAQILSEGSYFNMGKRNYLSARKILWKAGILVKGEAAGGELSRTIALEIGTGMVRWRTPGGADRLIFDPGASLKLGIPK